MRGLISALLLAAAIGTLGCGPKPTAPTPVGVSCGVERWPVKTLSDPDALRVNFTDVVQTTVKELNLLEAHCSGLPAARTYSQEFQVFEVSGRIVVVRSEEDRDYHIALSDLADPSYTIVTESADPTCDGAIHSPFQMTLSGARAAFISIIGGRPLSALAGTILRMRGVGFYDFNHGQTGRSQSCIELHPIVSVDRIQ